MHCIIKDKKTFRAISGATCAAVDWLLTMDSIYDEASDLRLIRAAALPEEGDFVYLENGYQGIVQEAETEDDAIRLKCRAMCTLFERDIYYTDPQGATLEQRLKHMIDANFTNQKDAVFRTPYLEVHARTATTADTRPDIDDKGLYSITAYIAKLMRLHQIFVTFTFGRESLRVDIARRTTPTRQIDFSDAGLRLKEQTFSRETTAKITVRAENTGVMKDWYLLSDGRVTDAYTEAGRAEGKWQFITVREAQDMADTVQDEFRSNTYSHKITFTAVPNKARFSFYDNVRIALEGRVFESYIAAVKTTKGSSLTEYECGELRTTYPLKKLI